MCMDLSVQRNNQRRLRTPVSVPSRRELSRLAQQRYDAVGATKQPDGQISSDLRKSCQVENLRKSKIFRFPSTQITGTFSPSRPTQRGALAIVTTRGGSRWTPGSRLTTAWIKRTAKPCGPGARCRRQAVGEA